MIIMKHMKLMSVLLFLMTGTLMAQQPTVTSLMNSLSRFRFSAPWNSTATKSTHRQTEVRRTINPKF
ncbi:MAG TPA: hypothetical protein VIX17_28395 [Pyrinomonadaceae bacterium]